MNEQNNQQAQSNQNNQENQVSQKEQEKQSAEKAGTLAADALLMYATGGKSKKLEKVPVVGSQINKKKKKLGKKVAKLDQKTGGNLGKVSKKADDAGALDAAQSGLNAMGGKGGAGKMPSGGASPSLSAPSSSSANAPSGSQRTPQKPNFAKNGLSNGNNIASSGGDGSKTKGLKDIFNRKHSTFRDKLMPGSGSNESNNSMNFILNGVAQLKKLIKFALLPLIAMLSFIIIIALLLTSFNSENDLSAVDRDIEEKETGGSSNTQYYAGGNKKLQDFYDRVLKIEEEYQSNGKSVNPMYITAAYHVSKEYDSGFSLDDMKNEKIKDMYDGMLGGSTVYNEQTYRDYLTNTFFPGYGFDESMSVKATDRVFEYIEQYEKRKKKDKNCKSTTGGSCTYNISGVHGYNTGALNLSNLQVRLMSSSFCKGKDNVVLNEDLVPFEKYVLGVTYGEIGEAFNTEVEKVHMIAARSFALSRPIGMNGSSGVKYVTENNRNILQIRACVADQVFCNTELGCSKDTPPGDQYGVVYSGTGHTYVYKTPLSNYPNSTLIDSWEKTMGMIGVDENNRVVPMGYSVGNGNKDDWVWKRWAEAGMDYTQIILSAYPEIKKIVKADCNTEKEDTTSKFLQIAQKLWKRVANGGYSYGMSSIPPTDGATIDCSSFVDWVLSEYGYDSFKGGQHVTQYFVNTDLSAAYGWTEISVAAGEDVTKKLKPGDILVRDPGNNNGHMNIIAQVTDDGRVFVYDCGGEDNWNNATARAGNPIESYNFIKTDRRPGKIIRISNISGDQCKSNESGEWSTWRQIPPAPWSGINLGNSNRTIGNYGCFITSIAIQIARSGAQTTLSEFNPGTFVQELNRMGNSFDGSGSFTGTGSVNITKIVPSFSVVNHAVSLPSDRAGKIRTIQNYIDQGYYVILRVKTYSGQHWVAVTGTTSDHIQMVDPGSDAVNVWDKYPVSESSTINVYKIG